MLYLLVIFNSVMFRSMTPGIAETRSNESTYILGFFAYYYISHASPQPTSAIYNTLSVD